MTKIEITGKMMLCEYASKKLLMEAAKYVCEVSIINKYTGEQRIYEYNTRKMQIVHFEVVTRPALYLL